MHGTDLIWVFAAGVVGGTLWSLLKMFEAMLKGEKFSLPKFGISAILSVVAAGSTAAGAAALPAGTDLWLICLGALATGMGGTAGGQSVIGVVAPG